MGPHQADQVEPGRRLRMSAEQLAGPKRQAPPRSTALTARVIWSMIVQASGGYEYLYPSSNIPGAEGPRLSLRYRSF